MCGSSDVVLILRAARGFDNDARLDNMASNNAYALIEELNPLLRVGGDRAYDRSVKIKPAGRRSRACGYLHLHITPGNVGYSQPPAPSYYYAVWTEQTLNPAIPEQR